MSLLEVCLVFKRQCSMLLLLLGALGPLFSSVALAASHQPSVVQPQEVRLGVLAIRGVPQAQASWQATANYLSSRMPGYNFNIVALPFDQVEPAVFAGQVDFVIVNSAIHVVLAEKYGVSPIATLVNRLDDYNASLFGGLIFRRAGSPGPATIVGLKGRHFLAVDATSLGGWLAAWRELKQNGINPDKDFASLKFTGTHDDVVLGVLAGKADAGTVRTDVVERMAAAGVINLAEIEVVASYKNGAAHGQTFPYLRSTRLYPEWPISRLPSVPDALARKVAVELLNMPKNSNAAVDAEIVGWNVPMSYIPVVDLLKDLGLPPFESPPLTLQRFAQQQPLAAALIVGGLAVTSTFLVLLLLMNRRLNRAGKVLLQVNQSLEQRVIDRTSALEQSRKLLEEQATHDSLTGLLNRRALETRMLDEVNRVNRYGYPLSVLMVDIDYFKNINDTFGHLEGDCVLCALANLLTETLRNTDIVARYGGEEFVVLLPMTAHQDALALAERLCQQVAANDFTLDSGVVVHLTISIGLASAPLGGNSRSDMLLDAADQAMYAAKQAGRNQVQVA